MKKMISFLTIVFAASLYLTSSFATKNINPEGATYMPECVVLLHGMGRTARSMKKIEKAIREEGYSVYNESYNDTSGEDGMLKAVNAGLNFCRSYKFDKIHFVTHSLGGIALRYYLTKTSIKKMGRVVMLAPPNHGSEVADAKRNKKWYKALNKRSGQMLVTAEDGFVKQLGPFPAGIPLGIIAGTKSSDPWFNYLFKRPHDGKVAVESTKLEGLADYIEVPAGHTYIMKNKLVIKNVVNFLKAGEFL